MPGTKSCLKLVGATPRKVVPFTKETALRFLAKAYPDATVSLVLEEQYGRGDFIVPQTYRVYFRSVDLKANGHSYESWDEALRDLLSEIRLKR